MASPALLVTALVTATPYQASLKHDEPTLLNHGAASLLVGFGSRHRGSTGVSAELTLNPITHRRKGSGWQHRVFPMEATVVVSNYRTRLRLEHASIAAYQFMTPSGIHLRAFQFRYLDFDDIDGTTLAVDPVVAGIFRAIPVADWNVHFDLTLTANLLSTTAASQFLSVNPGLVGFGESGLDISLGAQQGERFLLYVSARVHGPPAGLGDAAVWRSGHEFRIGAAVQAMEDVLVSVRVLRYTHRIRSADRDEVLAASVTGTQGTLGLEFRI